MKILEDAQKAYESGDVENAWSLTKKHLRWRNADGRGWELLGLIHHTRGRFALAVSALERASLLVPLRPAARVCLAYAYAKVGRRELSRDLLVALIVDESLSIALLLQVATALDAIDHPAWALRACRVASERDPHHPQAYFDMGYYATRCGHPPHLAESLARKAVSLAPDNACYRVGLASLLMKQGRAREAHAVVQHLSDDQIERIDCRCCLERIVNLFESAADFRRAVLCRQRLMTLEIPRD